MDVRRSKAGMRNFLFTVLFVVMTVTAAFAQEGAAPAKRHPELDSFERMGGKVEFVGRSYGLDGWLLTKNGESNYAYTTEEGGLVMGILLAPSGEYETAKQAQSKQARQSGDQSAVPGAEKTTQSKVERLYAEVEKAAWVRAGDENAPYMYIFINVSCEHCQEFWKDLSNPVKSGLVQVRLVPFGAIETNREGGAALLSVDDPAAAWKAYMDGDKTTLSKDKIKGDALKKIDANTALVKEWKLQGPPFTLYRHPSTGKLLALVGKPKNPMVVLGDLMKK